ncbi:MAG: hypothetical protein AAF515_06190 [Pseudomonadota bacterium]
MTSASNPAALMVDLEVIRDLLHEEELQATELDPAAPPLEAMPPEDAPREDQPALEMQEIVVPEDLGGAFEAAAPASDVTSMLLGPEFAAQMATILGKARDTIEEHPTDWSPQQTDELVDALRVRIDDAVLAWVRESLATHTEELELRLLSAVHNELADHLVQLRVRDADGEG